MKKLLFHIQRQLTENELLSSMLPGLFLGNIAFRKGSEGQRVVIAADSDVFQFQGS